MEAADPSDAPDNALLDSDADKEDADDQNLGRWRRPSIDFWARMGRAESAVSLSSLVLGAGEVADGSVLRARARSAAALDGYAGTLSPTVSSRITRPRAPTAPHAYAHARRLRLDTPPITEDETAAASADDVAVPASGGEGGMSVRVVGLLCLCEIAHFYSMCSIFSYAGFLCVDAGWVESADRAGFLAGLLATMLPLGRLPTSVPWGHLADKAGRRPALVGSMAGVALGSVAFAFCTDLRAALAVRFVLLGAGNGWVSILGPICAENAAGEQARLIGYVFGAGGVINMLGPAVGGLTYGSGPLGARFPAMVPSLIGAVLGALAALLAYQWLPETKPVAARPRLSLGPRESGASRASGPRLSGASHASGPRLSGASGGAAKKTKRLENGGAAGPGLGRALLTPPMPAMLVLRSGIGLATFASFDIVPLWAIASLDAGGVQLPKQSLGLLLAAAASVQLLWTTFAIGPGMARAGSRRTFAGACVVGACALVALPHTHTMPLLAVIPLVAAQAAALNTACTASIVATNEAVTLVAHELAGALNGVLVTAESVAKALGPAVGAPVFAAAITAWPASGGQQPSGAALTFAGLAVLVSLFGAGVARFLRALDSRDDIRASPIDGLPVMMM